MKNKPQYKLGVQQIRFPKFLSQSNSARILVFIKTEISYLLQTLRFWDNHHHVRSKSKCLKGLQREASNILLTMLSVYQRKKGLKIPKWVFRICKLSKDRQHKGLQTTITRTSLKTGGQIRCSGGVSSSCSTSGTRRVTLVTNPVVSYVWIKTTFYIISNHYL